MSQPILFHIDVNSAFLSWEATYRVKILEDTLDLRDIPSVIGGDIEKRKGIILAKSIPAKKYNIQTGEPVVEALSKCSSLVVVKPNYSLYEKCSKAFIAILKEYSPYVEQYSIDEAYMDMTGMEGLYGSPVAIAHVIKNRIYKELGFTVNIGISTNKLLAKMASDFQKPNLVHTLFPYEIKSKMWPLNTRDLFFVGYATENKLKKLGIYTIGQLATADPKLLKSHLHKHGELIYHYANGIDPSQIISKKVPNKGYGNSMTSPVDLTTFEGAQKVILSLCETLGSRLRADNAKTGCISVSIVDTTFDHTSHQKTIAPTTNTTLEIYRNACIILNELWDKQTPIRQLGVHTSKIVYDEHFQYNLFATPKDVKNEKLDKAIDSIRLRYGDDAVQRSTFLVGNLYHMSGGITKEKKTGITKYN